MDNIKLIDRIREEISKRNTNPLKIAKETGIPSYRIYKWLEGKGNPKVEDAEILEQWLSGTKPRFFTDIKINAPTFEAEAYINIIAYSKTILGLLAEVEAERQGLMLGAVLAQIEQVVMANRELVRQELITRNT